MFELRSINVDNFDEFYEYLSIHFPSDERKIKEKELEEISNLMFKPNFIYLDNVLVGYICCWEFSTFCFIEHFAILEEHRNKGIGTDFLKYFIGKSKKYVVLEVERPKLDLLPDESDLAYRRIKFYERIGFNVNNFDYQQPSYGLGLNPLPMYLCSYPKPLIESEYDVITCVIYHYVYNVKRV